MKRINSICSTTRKNGSTSPVFACISVLGFLGACAQAPSRSTLTEPALNASLDDSSSLFSGSQEPSGQVMVHLFEWKWDDVARECEAFLGPAGFHSVQISPPNEHRKIAGRPWWERYQPVSYRLESRSGNATEFKEMVDRCKAAGVQIVADAVVNHMSSGTENDVRVGRGISGSTFSKYSYPGIYTQSDFNTCSNGKPGNISNYNDAQMVRNCELVGLSDLKTSSEKVRNQVVSYLESLLQLGVSGFRIDAAKHMPVEDIEAIISKLSKRDNIFLEVIEGRSEPIQARDYVGAGRVTEFRYPEAIRDSFRSGQIASLLQFGERNDILQSESALVFIDNHDTQRGHGAGGAPLTHREEEAYELANAFMLAYPYGRPSIMSSYRFDNSEQGPPSDTSGQTRPSLKADLSGCTTGWICEHRWTGIAAMVGFRNATHQSELRHLWSNGSDQLAFARGNKGFFAANLGTKSNIMDGSFQTDLPAGKYCNVYKAGYAIDRKICRDSTFSVDRRGKVKIRIEGMGAVALHAGSRIENE